MESSLLLVVDPTLGMVPERERWALVVYPELKLFIVSCLVKVAPPVPFVAGATGASTAALAAACRSALSFFFSSFVCSPGHSAGTFISHLL
jgi:energy-converting hydrogenase Eha subunit B